MKWRTYAAKRASAAVDLVRKLQAEEPGATVTLYRTGRRLVVTQTDSFVCLLLTTDRKAKRVGVFNASASRLQIFATILEECSDAPDQ